jgi:uncharacterized protein with HEPN domain
MRSGPLGTSTRIDFSTFAGDAMRRDAVCFCLVAVGEACNRVSKDLPDLPPDIPWAQINGMRNILVHIYWVIDDTIVYNVARKEASILADQIDRLLESPA